VKSSSISTQNNYIIGEDYQLRQHFYLPNNLNKQYFFDRWLFLVQV